MRGNYTKKIIKCKKTLKQTIKWFFEKDISPSIYISFLDTIDPDWVAEDKYGAEQYK